MSAKKHVLAGVQYYFDAYGEIIGVADIVLHGYYCSKLGVDPHETPFKEAEKRARALKSKGSQSVENAVLWQQLDELRVECGVRSKVEADLRSEIAALRKERVQLQGENEALRAELDGEQSVSRAWKAAAASNAEEALRDAELTQGAIEKTVAAVEALEKRVAAIEKAPTVKPGDRVRIKPGARSLSSGAPISDKPVYEVVEGVCIAQVDDPNIRWIASPDSLLFVA